MMSSIRARARRVRSFAQVTSRWLDYPALAAAGWARDNPSSLLTGWMSSLRLRPSALRGAGLTLNTRDLGQLISFEEVFVEGIYDLGRLRFTPSLVIDCGAHVGFFSALATATFPRIPVIACEPNPVNVEWLRSNLIDGTRPVTIHAAAVSTHDGTGWFLANESNAGSLQDARLGIEVRVLDLAKLITGHADDSLLLKIDVEGEERRLLPHVIPVLPKRCAIFLETHHGPEALAQTIRQLQDASFSVTTIRERDAYADLVASREPG